MKGHFLLGLILAMILAGGCAGQPPAVGTPANVTPSGNGTSPPSEPGTPTPSLAVPTSSTTVPATSTTTSASSPTSVPGSTQSTAPAPAELKYRLIAQFGEPFFCDPDFYPVARVLTDQDVQARFVEIQKDTLVYQTILQHLGLAGQTTLSIEQERQVYAEYKKLNAIALNPSGGQYQFEIRIPADQRSGTAISGLIDTNGNITVTSRQPTINMCPICLAADSLIATPEGEIPVQDLSKGMLIWTEDSSGTRRAGFVVETARRDLAETATLVHLKLQDGRELTVSPGHPLTDGRIVADLALGDLVDGARISTLEAVIYHEGATFDILPSGETGFYWANGILLKSTIAP
jgi:Hint domain